jgi:polysaccharide export outer membrane protein
MLRRLRRLAAAIVVAALAAGTPAGAQNLAGYVIGPQDVLSITVFNQETLGGKYPVELDGSFSFPLIGRVRASGLTIGQVEAELKTRLADGFFTNPSLTVSIEQYRSQRVFVIGEVKNAGTYALAGGMTLIEALAKAGSTTPAAGEQVIVVRGRGPEAAEAAIAEASSDVVRVDLKKLQSGAGAGLNVVLNDGDTIYVPRAELIYVLGQVRNPGAYPLPAGATVLQVLALAGGVTPLGAQNRIEVHRVENGSKREIRLQLSDVVLPGDTLVVPERFF